MQYFADLAFNTVFFAKVFSDTRRIEDVRGHKFPVYKCVYNGDKTEDIIFPKDLDEKIQKYLSQSGKVTAMIKSYCLSYGYNTLAEWCANRLVSFYDTEDIFNKDLEEYGLTIEQNKTYVDTSQNEILNRFYYYAKGKASGEKGWEDKPLISYNEIKELFLDKG